VTTPLVVDFEFDEVCFCNNSTFTDITTGGVKPYTWQWDFGDGDSSTAQNATHHFDAAGNYSVTLSVTDSDSPSTTASQSYNVTVYPNPTVNITPDGGELTCATTFIILTADTTGSACGVTSYQWYKDDVALGGETGTTLNVTSPGDYRVEVACTNGCTDDDEVTVTQSADYPTVNITPDGGELTCATTFIILTPDTGGSACGVTSYQWYKDDVALGGQTGTTLNVTSSGDYKVEVGCANGCTDDDEVTVTQDISVPSVSAGPDQEVCEDGGPITLSGATPSGGTWGGTGVSGNAFDPSGVSPGDYTVTYSYTDISTGCSNSDTKTVTVNAKPTADAGADGVITVGGSLVIGGTPTASGGTPLYTCSWSPATGLDNASFANPTASPAVNTTYTVTVTDSNGCTDSDDVTVTVTQGCCIGGFVYRAGTMEPLAGWQVILERHTSPWVEIGSTITDASGKYLFCGLGDGEYRVFEVVQPGWSQVSPLPNQHLVALPLSCCDPLVGPFLNFQNQQGVANSTVGWEVSPVDRPTVMAPWIGLLAAIITGTSLLVLRRRHG
jgi:PKD repeat protein